MMHALKKVPKNSMHVFGQTLRSLSLADTLVSDVLPLAELKYLRELDLQNTQVSDEQVQELRQALPNCSIEYSINVEKIPSNHIL